LVAYVVEKLAPDPLDGEPPVAVQANVKGDVPPVAAAVNAAEVPTVPVVGPLIVTARVRGLTAIVAVPVAVFELPSVAVTLTV
jgi:hypothetical protein